jgi:hypothetical protein
MTDPTREEAPSAGKARLLRCDTCGSLVPRVSRVVIDRGYDRSNARPLWNCPDCFARKNAERQKAVDS